VIRSGQQAKYECEQGLEPAYDWPATNNNARLDTGTLFTYFGRLKKQSCWVQKARAAYIVCGAGPIFSGRESVRLSIRPSVRPSVYPTNRQQQRRPAGLLLSAGGVYSRYRSIAAGADADQWTSERGVVQLDRLAAGHFRSALVLRFQITMMLIAVLTRGKVLSWEYRSSRKRNSRPSSTHTILNAHSPTRFFIINSTYW